MTRNDASVAGNPETNESGQTNVGVTKGHVKDKHHSHHHGRHDFDIRRVTTLFEESLLGETDVDLAMYIKAWRMLNEMFPLFGRLFTFVQSDVADKERILQEFVDGEHNEKYSSVQSMLEHEVAMQTAHETHPASGSRTFLRLHRALEFVIAFLRDLHDAEQNASVAHLARASYDRTLAKHHGWLVRKGVHVAMYTLPTRQNMIIQLSHVDEPCSDEAARVMAALVKAGGQVYDRCQTALENKECLDLP